MMSVKYCLCGPLNLHLPSLYFCYFLMFVVSFNVLVFCRSLTRNCGFFMWNRKEACLAAQ
jgi:hypothetical protein